MIESTEQVLAGLVERMENRFYGKYRGLVRATDDPEGLGRLRLLVPSVLGPDVLTGWAMPCVPYGGTADTGMQFLPEEGSGVWVEFEEGDLEFPIWVGTFWSSPGGRTEMPPVTATDGSAADGDRSRPAPKILRTAKGHTLQFDDSDDAESVTLVDGAHHHVITLDDRGVTVSDGVSGHRIVLGPDGVEILDGLHGGNRLTLDADGIKIGSGASEAMVLGTSFKTSLEAFMTKVVAHTHASFGAPAAPALVPAQVPLSTRTVGG